MRLPATFSKRCTRRIGLGSLAQPKVQAEVALRDVAAAAANLLCLPVIAHTERDSRADSVAIGLRSFQFQ